MAMHSPTWQFTVDEFQKMGEVGIIGPEERAELIEGVVRAMSPIGSRHNWCVAYFSKRIAQYIGNQVEIFTQGALQVTDLTQPQPDICVTRIRGTDYKYQIPQPDDVILLIEIADSSLAFDRDEKLPIYASVGIPEYWLVDLVNQKLTCFSKPQGRRYLEQHVFTSNDSFKASLLGTTIEFDLSNIAE